MKILRIGTVLLAATLLLSGCSRTVHVDAAPDANNPACADVTVRLPDTVDGQTKNNTDAQATGSWGQPSSVITRCGITPVEVSTLRCYTVSGVDWLVDDSKAPNYRFITFARVPTTEVLVDNKVVSGAAVLDALSDAVNTGKVTRHCE